jgi:hypothetical protein
VLEVCFGLAADEIETVRARLREELITPINERRRLRAFFHAPGRIRTYDLWLRRPALYPLSYERARASSVVTSQTDDSLRP